MCVMYVVSGLVCVCGVWCVHGVCAVFVLFVVLHLATYNGMCGCMCVVCGVCVYMSVSVVNVCTCV